MTSHPPACLQTLAFPRVRYWDHSSSIYMSLTYQILSHQQLPVPSMPMIQQYIVIALSEIWPPVKQKWIVPFPNFVTGHRNPTWLSIPPRPNACCFQPARCLLITLYRHAPYNSPLQVKIWNVWSHLNSFESTLMRIWNGMITSSTSDFLLLCYPGLFEEDQELYNIWTKKTTCRKPHSLSIGL